jgi:hypothetical protein
VTMGVPVLVAVLALRRRLVLVLVLVVVAGLVVMPTVRMVFHASIIRHLPDCGHAAK